ncbi:tetratricopeptide repeat-containing sulfotransferase family protein [Pseudidiomarina andamanensis]|uniref:Sulfotransferase family protein n=1 Tax=Pseudidiomarina andamanensis TaxID=1940690 RepID=A0AA92ESY8_9GAMM|nr:sulfotransferase [Pseudidiomarina andamanensis]MDS0217798.1 sulfotransferase [Pseudidiomarina andamanensis]QGT94705.1 hypothetical protein D3795_00200 [Pseudidiomarina andamanensis]
MVKTYSLDDFLKAVRQGHRAESLAILNHFIDNKEPLKSDWIKCAALALRIGEIHKAKQAADFYRSEMPQTLRHLINYCGVYAEAGDLTKVQKLVEPQIKKDLKDPNLFHLAGTVAAQLGQLDRARNYLINALKLMPQSGITWFTLSSITDYKKYPELLDKLEQSFAMVPEADAKNRQQFFYSLGKAYADLGRFDDAYKAYAAGAEIMQQASRYSVKADEQFVNDIIANHSSDVVANLPRSRSGHNRAVALLGLPRSGTTLLGQMLAAHSKVKGAAETGAIGYASMHLRNENFADFPSFIKQHGDPQGAIDHISDVYAHVINQQFSGTNLVVDKTIQLSRHFAIWAQAFPQGKAIYIQRNPEDVAWSCFKSNFRGRADWSWKAEDIASYMRHEERLMQHWLAVFGDRILSIRYEDLCQNPEQTLKQVCAHLGLAFEPSMLHFYKDNGPVFTSSVGQVHEPIHQKRIGLSANFKDFLDAWRQS